MPEFTRKNPYPAKNYSVYLYSVRGRGTARKLPQKTINFVWFPGLFAAFCMNRVEKSALDDKI